MNFMMWAARVSLKIEVRIEVAMKITKKSHEIADNRLFRIWPKVVPFSRTGDKQTCAGNSRTVLVHQLTKLGSLIFLSDFVHYTYLHKCHVSCYLADCSVQTTINQNDVYAGI